MGIRIKYSFSLIDLPLAINYGLTFDATQEVQLKSYGISNTDIYEDNAQFLDSLQCRIISWEKLDLRFVLCHTDCCHL